MKYRIWSNEHNAWWRDSFCGYTKDINQAGVYDGLEEIKKRHPYLIGATPKDEDFLIPVIEELEGKSE